MGYKIVPSIVVVFLVACALPGLVLAQPEFGRGPGPGHDPVERMTQDLSLNQDQATKIKEIFESSRGSCEQANDRRSCMRSEHETNAAKIKSLLTAEQKKKFEEMVKNRPEPPDGPPRDGRGPR